MEHNLIFNAKVRKGTRKGTQRKGFFRTYYAKLSVKPLIEKLSSLAPRYNCPLLYQLGGLIDVI